MRRRCRRGVARGGAARFGAGGGGRGGEDRTAGAAGGRGGRAGGREGVVRGGVAAAAGGAAGRGAGREVAGAQPPVALLCKSQLTTSLRNCGQQSDGRGTVSFAVMEQTPSRLTIHGQDGMVTIDEGMVPVASSDEVTLFASELVKLELLMSYNQPRSITLRCAHSRHPRLFVSAVLTGVGLAF